MSSWEESRAVERDPAKVSGAWVFANTLAEKVSGLFSRTRHIVRMEKTPRE